MKQIKKCILLFFAATSITTNAGNECAPHPKQSDIIKNAIVSASTGVWPIMVRMERNAALRIAVTPKSGKLYNGSKITISLSGNNVLDNIESVSIHKSAANENDSGEHRFGDISNTTYATMDAKVISRASADIVPTRDKIEIPFNEGIYTSGTDIFYISVRLKNNANLDDRIGISLNSITFAESTIVLPKGITQCSQRIGYAIAIPGDSIIGGLAGNSQSGWFRIPGITRANNGTLISVFDVRYDSRADLGEKTNIDIGCSRSFDGGKTWSPIHIAAKWNPSNATSFDKADIYGLSDPCILTDENSGTVFVAALGGKGLADSAFGDDVNSTKTGQYTITRSIDNGETWESPISINPQVRRRNCKSFFQAPGHGIMLKKGANAGTLVFPSQIFSYDSYFGRPCHSTLIYSKDGGRTWISEDKKNATFGLGNATSTRSKLSSECGVVELADGSLMINAKNDGANSNKRCVFTTNNLGANWTEHATNLTMFAANCQGSILAIASPENTKQALLYSGPDSESVIRKNLTVRISYDEGKSWNADNAILYDERSIAGYSDLCETSDGYVGIIYEGVSDSRHLFFIRIPLSTFFPPIQ